MKNKEVNVILMSDSRWEHWMSINKSLSNGYDTINKTSICSQLLYKIIIAIVLLKNNEVYFCENSVNYDVNLFVDLKINFQI